MMRGTAVAGTAVRSHMPYEYHAQSLASINTGHAMCFMTRNLEGSACTCNPSVEPSAHTRTHNRSSEAPARRRIGRFRSELVEITTAWKYVFMTFK